MPVRVALTLCGHTHGGHTHGGHTHGGHTHGGQVNLPLLGSLAAEFRWTKE